MLYKGLEVRPGSRPSVHEHERRLAFAARSVGDLAELRAADCRHRPVLPLTVGCAVHQRVVAGPALSAVPVDLRVAGVLWSVTASMCADRGRMYQTASGSRAHLTDHGRLRSGFARS